MDNFFSSDEIGEVMKIANSCQMNRVRQIPGSRSEPLHMVNYDFYRYLNLKILSLLYPNQVTMGQISFASDSRFQCVPKGVKSDGWVHLDMDKILTSIIYLSESTAGTSIYSPKNLFFVPDITPDKHEYFSQYEKSEDKDLSIINQKRDDWNNLFEETISYRGKFNRMIYFDGNEHHASHINEDDCDRLILITFFEQITLNGTTINYPIPTMRSR
tara:strand:+ start:944 stop:1588 length:645 start_codon:yes stop_codon:yes gene_type:complete